MATAGNKVIYPGTFDPITKGHMDVLQRAAKMFSHVIIAVAKDSNKNTLFSLQERVEIIMQELSDMGITNVEVQSFSGLLINFAKEQKVFTIIRGLRGVSDFEYEFQLAYMNNKMAPEVETIFIPATENSHYISSRFVKEVTRLGGDLDKFVSENVKQRLRKCLCK